MVCALGLVLHDGREPRVQGAARERLQRVVRGRREQRVGEPQPAPFAFEDLVVERRGRPYAAL
jgi:hypothetical protein